MLFPLDWCDRDSLRPLSSLELTLNDSRFNPSSIARACQISRQCSPSTSRPPWMAGVMVKASELLGRFDVVLVVNRHNEPALLIQHPQVMALYP
jgi:hypothetical protein